MVLCTVVGRLARHPKVKGLSPASAARIGRVELANDKNKQIKGSVDFAATNAGTVSLLSLLHLI